MTTSEFIAGVILKATGKVSTSVEGDVKWTKVLAIANQYIKIWADEPNVDWNSLYDPELTIGTVTATDRFELDTDIRKLSDTRGDVVRIDHTDGGYTNFDIVSAENLKRYYSGDKSSSNGNYCAQIGTNLVFNRSFTSTDLEYGGTIKAPVYNYPEPLVAIGDTVPVDNPMWLVIITAAEYVRNDVVRQNQYPNLVAEANQLMQRMKDDNEAQVESAYMIPITLGRTW